MADPSNATGHCAAMSATSEEHKRFEPFAGTFKAEIKMWMGPGEPMVSTGTMVNELDLGGRYLKQVFTGDPNDGPFPSFEGRGFWGYNTAEKKYEGFWIDNACTLMQTESGHVDEAGTVWTMHGEMTDPQSGGTLKKRSIITLEDNDHHSMEMYFTAPGGAESKAMEIRYERVS